MKHVTGKAWKPAGARSGGEKKPAAPGAKQPARGGDADDDRVPKGSTGYAKRLCGEAEKESGSAREPAEQGKRRGFLGDAEPARKSRSTPRPGTPAPAAPSAPVVPPAKGARGDKKAEHVERAPSPRPAPVLRLERAMPAPGRALEVRVGEGHRHQAREALLRFLVDRNVEARYVSPSAKKDVRSGFFGRIRRARGSGGTVQVLVRLSPDEARGITSLLGRFGSLDKRYAPSGKASRGKASGGLREGHTPRVRRRSAQDKESAAAGSAAGRASSGEKAGESKEWILIILRG